VASTVITGKNYTFDVVIANSSIKNGQPTNATLRVDVTADVYAGGLTLLTEPHLEDIVFEAGQTRTLTYNIRVPTLGFNSTAEIKVRINAPTGELLGTATEPVAIISAGDVSITVSNKVGINVPSLITLERIIVNDGGFDPPFWVVETINKTYTTAPLVLTDLITGTWNVRVVADNYTTQETSIEIQAGGVAEVPIILSKSTGSISVLVIDDRDGNTRIPVDIWYDGVKQTTVPVASLPILDVPLGTHSISINTPPGYQIYPVQSVDVNVPEEPVVVTIRLVANVGDLKIYTVDKRPAIVNGVEKYTWIPADIYIKALFSNAMVPTSYTLYGGGRAAEDPVNLTGIPEGLYGIKAILSDYQTVELMEPVLVQAGGWGEHATVVPLEMTKLRGGITINTLADYVGNLINQPITCEVWIDGYRKDDQYGQSIKTPCTIWDIETHKNNIEANGKLVHTVRLITWNSPTPGYQEWVDYNIQVDPAFPPNGMTTVINAKITENKGQLNIRSVSQYRPVELSRIIEIIPLNWEFWTWSIWKKELPPLPPKTEADIPIVFNEWVNSDTYKVSDPDFFRTNCTISLDPNAHSHYEDGSDWPVRAYCQPVKELHQDSASNWHWQDVAYNLVFKPSNLIKEVLAHESAHVSWDQMPFNMRNTFCALILMWIDQYPALKAWWTKFETSNKLWGFELQELHACLYAFFGRTLPKELWQYYPYLLPTDGKIYQMHELYLAQGQWLEAEVRDLWSAVEGGFDPPPNFTEPGIPLSPMITQDTDLGFHVSVYGANGLVVASGTTPLLTTRLPSGFYTIGIVQEGYKVFEQVVIINPGGTTDVYAEMIRNMGIITLTVVDGDTNTPIVGAMAEYDNVPFGLATDVNGITSKSEVPVGMHSIGVTAEGYQLFTDWINIDAGGNTQVICKMVAKIGKIRVVTLPQGVIGSTGQWEAAAITIIDSNDSNKTWSSNTGDIFTVTVPSDSVYIVRATLYRFGNFEQTGVMVDPGGTTIVNCIMQIGSLSVIRSDVGERIWWAKRWLDTLYKEDGQYAYLAEYPGMPFRIHFIDNPEDRLLGYDKRMEASLITGIPSAPITTSEVSELVVWPDFDTCIVSFAPQTLGFPYKPSFKFSRHYYQSGRVACKVQLLEKNLDRQVSLYFAEEVLEVNHEGNDPQIEYRVNDWAPVFQKTLIKGWNYFIYDGPDALAGDVFATIRKYPQNENWLLYNINYDPNNPPDNALPLTNWQLFFDSMMYQGESYAIYVYEDNLNVTFYKPYEFDYYTHLWEGSNLLPSVSASRYTMRHGARFGQWIYEIWGQTDRVNKFTSIRNAKGFGVDVYDSLFGKSTEQPDDYMYQTYCYPDIPSVWQGLPKGKYPSIYPYLSKIQMGFPETLLTYIANSKSDPLLMNFEAIHILNKYSPTEGVNAANHGYRNGLTPFAVAMSEYATEWNGYGIHGPNTEPSWGTSIRTAGLLVLCTLLGYKFNIQVMKEYADNIYNSITGELGIQAGLYPLRENYTMTAENGILLRPQYTGAFYSTYKQIGNFAAAIGTRPTMNEILFDDKTLHIPSREEVTLALYNQLSNIFDIWNMPPEECGPITGNMEATCAMLQALRVYAYHALNRSIPDPNDAKLIPCKDTVQQGVLNVIILPAEAAGAVFKLNNTVYTSGSYITPGTYSWSCELAGWGTQTGTVTINIGTQTLTITLIKQAILHLNYSPANATFALVSQQYGTTTLTPGTWYVGPVSYSWTLSSPGYVTKTASLPAVPGGEYYITEILQQEVVLPPLKWVVGDILQVIINGYPSGICTVKSVNQSFRVYTLSLGVNPNDMSNTVLITAGLLDWAGGWQGRVTVSNSRYDVVPVSGINYYRYDGTNYLLESYYGDTLMWVDYYSLGTYIGMGWHACPLWKFVFYNQTNAYYQMKFSDGVSFLWVLGVYRFAYEADGWTLNMI
jgi:hypothetical protein